MAGPIRASASVRAASEKRRPVLKYALEKPYTTLWPAAPQELQSALVDELCSAVNPVCAYFAESRRVSKQQGVRRARAARRMKRASKAGTSTSVDSASPSNDSAPKIDRSSVRSIIRERGSGEGCKADIMDGLALLDHIVIGINANTRALEKQTRAASRSDNGSELALVLVCRAGIDPQLVAHFPALAHVVHNRERAVANHTDNGSGLRLVGLGKGLEQRLATAIGHDQVTVLGIRAGSPVLDRVIEMARSRVPAPSVPWIDTSHAEQGQPGHTNGHILHPMAVRELHTSAPIQQKRPKPERANTERTKSN
ncbi:RNase P and RNase MRP subunit [Coemansia interrupta]|uniref:RNase P and RNase MRP subunit n=1 Tax=Coemansia interrupta TaxID=1126814 RepID=A0A9W8HJR5_9FUNG|nr:RNase P and RNase MRP subunit [Coemansia interrupta]